MHRQQGFTHLAILTGMAQNAGEVGASLQVSTLLFFLRVGQRRRKKRVESAVELCRPKPEPLGRRCPDEKHQAVCVEQEGGVARVPAVG